MNDLTAIAPAFVEMAHRIVWCSAATVDSRGRPRLRILHPLWQWDGARLVGWIGTGPTPIKRAHLAAHPYMSVSYWTPSHDTCVADCRAALVFDDETRTVVWNLLRTAPAPLGYDPGLFWASPTSDSFAVLRLEPWRLRVMPGSVMLERKGETLTWQE
jgi:hypothetical protein